MNAVVHKADPETVNRLVGEIDARRIRHAESLLQPVSGVFCVPVHQRSSPLQPRFQRVGRYRQYGIRKSPVTAAAIRQQAWRISLGDRNLFFFVVATLDARDKPATKTADKLRETIPDVVISPGIAAVREGQLRHLKKSK